MTYTVISDLEVCNKVKGEKLTDKELLEAGANIDALVESGHIVSDVSGKSTPAPEGATE